MLRWRGKPSPEDVVSAPLSSEQDDWSTSFIEDESHILGPVVVTTELYSSLKPYTYTAMAPFIRVIIMELDLVVLNSSQQRRSLRLWQIPPSRTQARPSPSVQTVYYAHHLMQDLP